MGNCFGKQSSSDEAFSGPGRTLGSAPPGSSEPNARATIPANRAQKSQGRTLGGGDGTGDGTGDDPRAAAARAAEVGASFVNKSKTGQWCAKRTILRRGECGIVCDVSVAATYDACCGERGRGQRGSFAIARVSLIASRASTLSVYLGVQTILYEDLWLIFYLSNRSARPEPRVKALWARN